MVLKQQPMLGAASIVIELEELPSAQPELIEKAAYIRGFEQGRTQGMVDSQGGKKCVKQRKVLITTTYNEMGIIIDTKAEEVAQPETQWIPCSERLPENDDEVLITIWDAEDDYVEVYKGFYQGHEWWTQWCHGCSKIKDEPCGENIVIAWMPLPDPYRGGEK